MILKALLNEFGLANTSKKGSQKGIVAQVLDTLIYYDGVITTGSRTRETTRREVYLARHYEYTDRDLYAVVFANDLLDVSVEMLDQTAQIYVNRGNVTNRFTIELPGRNADASVTNGVLTIEIPNKS